MLVRVAAEQLMVNDKIWVNGSAPGWINPEMNATLPADLRECESAKIWMG
jgi:NAD(P)-dependent dehydrogenase (short-subunit alcohol dehydrogenase family)